MKPYGRYFAIKIGDKAVEIRVASAQPKATISRLTRVVNARKKLVLEQKFYSGGKILGFCTYRFFYKKTGIPIERDQMIEISRKDRLAVLRSR